MATADAEIQPVGGRAACMGRVLPPEERADATGRSSCRMTNGFSSQGVHARGARAYSGRAHGAFRTHF
ncbi:hypothetical protein [Chachezhania antarctica]|uniref:hypothetical protein n=1 Tax=Chachezhania antarctica TaxID=2340860 RepID=UPI0013CF2E1A|nr:hypothetical protein [Chachezhania antarctica]